jgi:hypothetical protein
MSNLIALEEYRPAWEIGGMLVPGKIIQIERGWQIRMDDGSWESVHAVEEWYDTEGTRDPVVVVVLADGTRCDPVYSTDVIMSRRYAPEPKD